MALNPLSARDRQGPYLELMARREGLAPWSGGGHPVQMAGGRDLQVIYRDEQAGLLKSPVWIQRKSNLMGITGQSALGVSVSGEIMAGATATHSGIRSYMRNRGKDNDATAFMGRTANVSDGGMSCGTFGAASVESVLAKATMGMECHIYTHVPTTPRDATGDDWYVGMHVLASGDVGAAHHGIYMGGGGTAVGKYGFWNGLTIGGHAFAHNGQPGPAGTVGINMAWISQFAETAIKLGAVGKHHISRAGGNIYSNHTLWEMQNENGKQELFLRPKSDAFATFGIKPMGGEDFKFAMNWDGTNANIKSYGTAQLRFFTDDVERFRITAAGYLLAIGLPTSATGLPANAIWRSGNDLKIV